MYKSDCHVVHAPLAALDTQEVACSLTAPYAARWALYVTVDSLGEVVEADEANNMLVESDLDVERCQLPIQPDLMVQAIRFTPSTPRPGEPVTIEAEVFNRGNAPYTVGVEAIFSEVDKLGSFVRGLCDEWHDFDLAPGASRWVSCASQALSQGTRHVKAEVTGFDEESSYCNNATTIRIDVRNQTQVVVPIE